MAEFTFKLREDAKEYDGSRFGGQEIVLTLPDTLDGVRGMIEDGVDQDAVLLGLITGQGLRLTKQKTVKDVLGAARGDDQKYKGNDGQERDLSQMDTAEILAFARSEAEGMKLGAPRVRKAGGKQSKAVAEARAEAEKANAAVRTMYQQASPAVRKQFRPSLVEQFGEDTVAGWEQDAA